MNPKYTFELALFAFDESKVDKGKKRPVATQIVKLPHNYMEMTGLIDYADGHRYKLDAQSCAATLEHLVNETVKNLPK